jgi:hypothetical protein
MSAVPHSPQNLKWPGFSLPHLAQRFRSGCPQLPQKLVTLELSVLQLEQRIGSPFI